MALSFQEAEGCAMIWLVLVINRAVGCRQLTRSLGSSSTTYSSNTILLIIKVRVVVPIPLIRPKAQPRDR